jgi:hypothetical protein
MSNKEYEDNSTPGTQFAGTNLISLCCTVVEDVIPDIQRIHDLCTRAYIESFPISQKFLLSSMIRQDSMNGRRAIFNEIEKWPPKRRSTRRCS